MTLRIIKKDSKDFVEKNILLKKDQLSEELRFWEIMTDPTSYHISQSKNIILDRFIKVQKQTEFQSKSYAKYLFECKKILEKKSPSCVELHGHMEIGRFKRLKHCLDPNTHKNTRAQNDSLSLSL